MEVFGQCWNIAASPSSVPLGSLYIHEREKVGRREEGDVDLLFSIYMRERRWGGGKREMLICCSVYT